MLRALLELSRISNLPTVWTNVLAAYFLAHGVGWSPALGWLLVGASFVYSGGMVLNDAADAKWDREHRKERPIPSGRIGLATTWIIGLAWLLGGAAMMLLPGHANEGFTALLVLAVLAYDFYHKQWTGSVLVMGACRTLLYYTVITGIGFPKGLCQSGIVLGIYIVGLTLMARGEASGKLSKLRRTLIMLLIALPGLLGLFANSVFDAPLIGLSLLQVMFATLVADHMKKGGPAIGQGVGWLLAGIPLVDALAIAPLSLITALCFAGIVPLLRLWQRWIAAT
jgi:4-hydroxybenzoate polyprenyltransferase